MHILSIRGKFYMNYLKWLCRPKCPFWHDLMSPVIQGKYLNNWPWKNWFWINFSSMWLILAVMSICHLFEIRCIPREAEPDENKLPISSSNWNILYLAKYSIENTGDEVYLTCHSVSPEFTISCWMFTIRLKRRSK